ncbi:hypothetical protein GALMADRAFT_1240895 [Galerina marginata CBS 339.88]|uniref:Uncharacterized protein n=1 Tax=Galerina marginata (strain CBS 339.88) TaxID=685588 RepID=A0A067T8M5_GALM3|nr:hypothetical protein GALMADRAFT_1240895 [Galerina marginata CBS 339.88]
MDGLRNPHYLRHSSHNHTHSKSTAMSHEVVDDSAIEWKTFTSKNGAPFQVGVKKGVIVPPEDKKPFDIAVNWPVGDDTWKPTSEQVLTVAAITRYRLYANSQDCVEGDGSLYSWRLDVTTTEHYDYIFVDGTGDIYEINVWADGNHFMRYNSTNPTITHIKGD